MKTQTAPKKLTKKQKDEILASQLPGLLNYHQTMLSDGVRNKLLYQALQNSVTEETNFLDVGAGTGVWAILAAKLGAKRVVAIEIEEPLIPIIFKHAQENGVAHKVEIIHANSDDVKIRGKFDLIVSELFQQDALSERVVNSFMNIRNRFLAPNGVLIPQKLSMLAVPIFVERSVQDMPRDLPISCSYMKTLKINYSTAISIENRKNTKFLSEPQLLVEMDFRTVEKAPELKNFAVGWKMDNLSQANAIAVFNMSTFTDEIVMNSFNSQSWGATIYEFQPIQDDVGELRFTINMDGAKSVWGITTVSQSGTKVQNFSPTFTPARVKMAQQMTPFRRFKPQKAAENAAKNDKKRAVGSK